MVKNPADNLPGPFSYEGSREVISEDQITDLAARTTACLNVLFKKASVMEEEANRPILTPEEHTYINHAISTAAHLVRYWLESPTINMPPPETLNFAIEMLRQSGIKFASAADDIANDKQLFTSLLNTAATRREYTSRLNPQANKKAVVCARELVNLMPVLATYNGHSLPTDYSVEMSLDILNRMPIGVGEGNYMSSLNIEELNSLLTGLEPDSSGYIRLDESHRLRLEAMFKNNGIAVSQPTLESIEDGIASARELAHKGRAEEYLKALPFTSSESLPKSKGKPVAVVLEYPIFINPESIAGANSFEDWAGRSHNLKQDDMGDKKPSLEVITDYATRGTPLPEIELTLIPREDDSIILYAENAHRTAAAKLRSEPLAVTSFQFYK